jgi:ribonucleotide monophosphatase NagD (HAD superfamily)
MDELKRVGIRYITGRYINHERDAVMFDIDDTLIYLTGTPIDEMIELLEEAKILGYKIVIITARPELKRVMEYTVNELHQIGIEYDELYFIDAHKKGDLKKEIGYNFILSVGDNWTDLTESQHWLNTSSFDHS